MDQDCKRTAKRRKTTQESQLESVSPIATKCRLGSDRPGSAGISAGRAWPRAAMQGQCSRAVSRFALPARGILGGPARGNRGTARRSCCAPQPGVECSQGRSSGRRLALHRRIRGATETTTSTSSTSTAALSHLPCTRKTAIQTPPRRTGSFHVEVVFALFIA